MHNTSNLLQRLERLEGQNRWLKFIGIGCLLVIGLVVSMGTQEAKPELIHQIRVKKLFVEGDDGKIRCVLSGNGPRPFEVRDAKGICRIGIFENMILVLVEYK